MARRLTISVDHNRCVGTTLCVQFASSTFTLDARGLSQVVNTDGDSEPAIVMAAEQCPTGAITVRDADTGEILFQG